MLNLYQASEVFRRNAIAFGTKDGMVLSKALKILGEDAVRYVCENPIEESGYRRTVYVSSYGIGEKYDCCNYLTFDGFMKAVTYNNIIEVTQGADYKHIDDCRRSHSRRKTQKKKDGTVIPFRRSV